MASRPVRILKSILVGIALGVTGFVMTLSIDSILLMVLGAYIEYRLSTIEERSKGGNQ